MRRAHVGPPNPAQHWHVPETQSPETQGAAHVQMPGRRHVRGAAHEASQTGRQAPRV
jgi:hypothetical protein